MRSQKENFLDDGVGTGQRLKNGQVEWLVAVAASRGQVLVTHTSQDVGPLSQDLKEPIGVAGGDKPVKVVVEYLFLQREINNYGLFGE